MIAGMIIFAIARYNKSNKLFWQLIISLLFGFVCGHVGASFGKNTKKSVPVVVSKTPLTSIMSIEKYSLDCITNETIDYVNEVCASDSSIRNTYTKIADAGLTTKPVTITYSFEPYNTS